MLDVTRVQGHEKGMIILTYDNELHRKQLVDLWTQVFGYEASYNAPEVVIDEKRGHDDLLYVAVDGDRVIGSAMVGYDGHRGWIYSVAVHPSARRQNVGSSLLNHALEKLAELGCHKVNLQIIEENSEVLAFYEAHGFAVERRISMGKQIG